MAVFPTQLPKIAFPWEVDSIQFRLEEISSLYVRLTFSDKEIYSALLYTGVPSTRLVLSPTFVVAENISQLIIDECQTRCAPLTIYYSEDGTTYTESQTIRIIPCNIVTQYRASEIATSSFLTLLGDTKQTAVDGREVLRLYTPTSSSPEALSLTATFVSSSGTPYEVTNSDRVVGMPSEVSSFLVDMSSISSWRAHPSDCLAKVVVRVGTRKQTYLVNPHLRHSLRFMNCFYSEDVIYFSEIEREVKPTRTSGQVSGKHVTFFVEPSSKTKGTTAPLLDSELDWAEDAVHSIYFKDSDDRDVSITDNTFKYDSGISSMPRLTLTWELYQYRYKFSRTVKTFDFTFDETYG